MKVKEIREKDDSALRGELAELGKQLFTLRTQEVTNKLEDPSKIRKVKKDVARIQTVLSERKNAAAKTAATSK